MAYSIKRIDDDRNGLGPGGIALRLKAVVTVPFHNPALDCRCDSRFGPAGDAAAILKHGFLISLLKPDPLASAVGNITAYDGDTVITKIFSDRGDVDASGARRGK